MSAENTKNQWIVAESRAFSNETPRGCGAFLLDTDVMRNLSMALNDRKSTFLYFWEFRERRRIRDGYGIGRIVRLGDFVELENHFQGILDLGFRSASVAADAFFHLERSEFGERNAAFGNFCDYRSSGLGYGDAGFDVGREK